MDYWGAARHIFVYGGYDEQDKAESTSWQLSLSCSTLCAELKGEKYAYKKVCSKVHKPPH